MKKSPIEILDDGIISRKTEGSFGYHAWGTVAKMTDGEGKERMAFCGGGFLSVVSGVMNLVVDELIFSEAIDAEKVRLERDRLASEFSACDAKKQPERAEFLKSSLARAEIKLKACE